MKYEIITDSEDLLVLTVNSRVIEVSQNISEILHKIEEDYTNYMNKKKKAAERNTTEVKEDKSADVGSLGKLFGL